MPAFAMNTEVRMATAEHIELWTELVVMLYRDDPGPVPMAPERARAQFRALLDGGRTWPLILLRGSAVVGYALVVPFYSNEFGGDVLVLDEFFVRQEHRSAGTGSGTQQHTSTALAIRRAS